MNVYIRFALLATVAICAVGNASALECPAPGVPCPPAAAAIIGHHFWKEAGAVSMCAAPLIACPFDRYVWLDPNAEGNIIGFALADGSLGVPIALVHLRLTDGRDGFMQAGHMAGFVYEDPRATEQRRHAELKACIYGLATLRIGSRVEEARAVPCKPDHINTTETASTYHEQWVYEFEGVPSLGIAGRNTYLYFNNGRLVAKQD